MTVAEIIGWAIDEYGERNLTTPEQGLKYLNQVQQMAFDRDLDAFIEYNKYLIVNPSSPQGPYPMPTSPGVRKVIGVTTLTAEQLVAIRQGGQLTVRDYGLPTSTIDERNVYEPIEIYNFPPPITFRFVADAATIDTTANKYRLVYYMSPPKIRTIMDDSNLWIPEAFHYNMCVEGIKKLADASNLGDKAPKAAMEPFLSPFWDTMTQAQDLGNRDNMFSEGQPGV